MRAVDFKASLFFKLGKQRGQLAVIDLNGITAFAANQVMVVAPGGLVNEMPVADMRDQYQALVGQEIQRAVNGRFSKTRQALDGALINGDWAEMPAVFFKYL